MDILTLRLPNKADERKLLDMMEDFGVAESSGRRGQSWLIAILRITIGYLQRTIKDKIPNVKKPYTSDNIQKALRILGWRRQATRVGENKNKNTVSFKHQVTESLLAVLECRADFTEDAVHSLSAVFGLYVDTIRKTTFDVNIEVRFPVNEVRAALLELLRDQVGLKNYRMQESLQSETERIGSIVDVLRAICEDTKFGLRFRKSAQFQKLNKKALQKLFSSENRAIIDAKRKKRVRPEASLPISPTPALAAYVLKQVRNDKLRRKLERSSRFQTLSSAQLVLLQKYFTPL